MNVAIVQFPGTNCDLDTQYAFEKAGAKTQFVWHKDVALSKTVDLVVLPGGFSYGDYLRSGAIAKFSPIMAAVINFADRGGRVLGICNGFQILLESHLLPGAMKKNQNVHFISRYHHLKVENVENAFLQNFQKGDVLNVPIAHGEGNYYIDDAGLQTLRDHDQILLSYCDSRGETSNPNGSVAAIAGICNRKRNVFGLMPHPERAMEPLLGSDDGMRMIQGLLR